MRFRKTWILGATAAIQLLMGTDSSAVDTKWRREFRAKLDGQVVDCAFAGGMEFSKPAFADIDADGDPDLFVGDADGRIRSFRNQGTAQAPCWLLLPDFYDYGLGGERSFPAYADIDDDGDLDWFIGYRSGRMSFFKNIANASSPMFVQVTDFYDSIDVGSESTPAFADIDADMDLDLFVGKADGCVSFYRNMGTAEIPLWNLISEQYGSIDVGALSVPVFVDIDADGDLDLFVGEEYGNINYYRNAGNDTLADWELVSDYYNSIDVGQRSSPAFVDVDGDADLDLFIGQDEGQISFYRNDGGVQLPSWTLVPESYLFLDFGATSSPALADINNENVEQSHRQR